MSGCVGFPPNCRGEIGHAASLRAQAFGEIAAEQMLSEMHELAVEIDPDLPAHVAPAAAEGVILG